MKRCAREFHKVQRPRKVAQEPRTNPRQKIRTEVEKTDW